jgi:hypothetical protein
MGLVACAESPDTALTHASQAAQEKMTGFRRINLAHCWNDDKEKSITHNSERADSS